MYLLYNCNFTKAIIVSNIEDKMSVLHRQIINVKPIDIDRPLVAGIRKNYILLIFWSLVLINNLIVNCNDCDKGFLCFTITSEVEGEILD